MKKSFMFILCLAFPYFLMAQEIEKQKEIGLVFSNFDSYGLTYKSGTEKSLWRFNTLALTGNNTIETADSSEEKRTNSGFGIKIGKEYRKDIVENLAFRYGADLSFSYLQSLNEQNDKSIDDNDNLTEQKTYRPGINFVLGFNYEINENFIIGAEILPQFTYITGTSVEKRYYENDGEEVKNDISGFSYGISNSGALLTLAYKF